MKMKIRKLSLSQRALMNWKWGRGGGFSSHTPVQQAFATSSAGVKKSYVLQWVHTFTLSLHIEIVQLFSLTFSLFKLPAWPTKEDVMREFLWSLKLNVYEVRNNFIKFVSSGLALDTKLVFFFSISANTRQIFLFSPRLPNRFLFFFLINCA